MTTSVSVVDRAAAAAAQKLAASAAVWSGLSGESGAGAAGQEVGVERRGDDGQAVERAGGRGRTASTRPAGGSTSMRRRGARRARRSSVVLPQPGRGDDERQAMGRGRAAPGRSEPVAPASSPSWDINRELYASRRSDCRGAAVRRRTPRRGGADRRGRR